MKKRIRKSTRQNKAEILKANKGDCIVVGLDVHKKSYHVAVRKNGKLAATWVMPHDDRAVVKMLAPAVRALRKVVYEAGPTGYGLARRLQQAGIPVQVVAPGKTPKAPNDGNKSDRLDCRKLAAFAEKDLLGYVAVPTEKEDAERAIKRRRDTLRRSGSKAKTRIKSFLLYHGLPEPDGLKKWTLASIESLRRMRLGEDLRFMLDSLLRELAACKAELLCLDRKLSEIQRRHKKEAELLLTHPGTGKQTVRHMLTEIFRPGRFPGKREVVAYVGLAPKVSRSGQTCRSGGRLRGGRRALRDCLIEASWMWIRKEDAARELYHHLLRNTGEGKKAITALARRMLVNLWNMWLKGESYRPLDHRHVGAVPTSS